MHILAISGSLRQGSHNTALLRAAADMLPPGVTVDLYDRLEEIPAFNEDRVAQRPEPVDRLWDAVAEADGVLIATPEYNTTIPGQLKQVASRQGAGPRADQRPLGHGGCDRLQQHSDTHGTSDYELNSLP